MSRTKIPQLLKTHEPIARRRRGVISSLAAALVLVMASSAQAKLSIELEWTATTGDGTIGTNVIEAVRGDEITLDIIVAVDSAGVDSYSLSVAFDEDLMDELDIVETIEFAHIPVIPCDPLIEEQIGEFPDCVTLFGPELENLNEGIESETESTGAVAGLAEGFEASAPTLGPDAGPLDLRFRVGRIVFRVTRNVATDGDDLEGSVLSLLDGYTDNALTFVGRDMMPSPAVVPGFATVNAPEPGAGLLAAAGLATLLALRRSGRLRVPGPRAQ
jgi:hypothetical protein